MKPEDERQVALIFKLRAEYADKVLARRFNCSIMTLYRAARRAERQEAKALGNITPPTESQPA